MSTTVQTVNGDSPGVGTSAADPAMKTVSEGLLPVIDRIEKVAAKGAAYTVLVIGGTLLLMTAVFQSVEAPWVRDIGTAERYVTTMVVGAVLLVVGGAIRLIDRWTVIKMVERGIDKGLDHNKALVATGQATATQLLPS